MTPRVPGHCEPNVLLVGVAAGELVPVFSSSGEPLSFGAAVFLSLVCKACAGEVMASASAPCLSSRADMLSLPNSEPVQLVRLD